MRRRFDAAGCAATPLRSQSAAGASAALIKPRRAWASVARLHCLWWVLLGSLLRLLRRPKCARTRGHTHWPRCCCARACRCATTLAASGKRPFARCTARELSHAARAREKSCAQPETGSCLPHAQGRAFQKWGNGSLVAAGALGGGEGGRAAGRGGPVAALSGDGADAERAADGGSWHTAHGARGRAARRAGQHARARARVR